MASFFLPSFYWNEVSLFLINILLKSSDFDVI